MCDNRVILLSILLCRLETPSRTQWAHPYTCLSNLSQLSVLCWPRCTFESCPFHTAARLHPELCTLIEHWRKRLSPTKLSDVLTRSEGSLVVDYAANELERAGIIAIPIHDAVVVPASRADEARVILLGVCRWHLGFEPRVSIKESEIGNSHQ